MNHQSQTMANHLTKTNVNDWLRLKFGKCQIIFGQIIHIKNE